MHLKEFPNVCNPWLPSFVFIAASWLCSFLVCKFRLLFGLIEMQKWWACSKWFVKIKKQDFTLIIETGLLLDQLTCTFLREGISHNLRPVGRCVFSINFGFSPYETRLLLNHCVCYIPILAIWSKPDLQIGALKFIFVYLCYQQQNNLSFSLGKQSYLNLAMGALSCKEIHDCNGHLATKSKEGRRVIWKYECSRIKF